MSKTSDHIPVRTCLGCCQKKEKFSLIRFVFNKEHNFIIDPSQTGHGRGNYICSDLDCLIELKKSKKLKKITTSVGLEIKNEFMQELEKMIQPDKIFSLTGLARRAGKLAIGAQAVEAAIKKKQARLVILAEDSAPNTREHFENLISKFERKLLVYGKKDNWGQLFAKENTAVIAILNDNFAKVIKKEFESKQL